MIFRSATPADRPALIDLLTEVDLLTDDLPKELGTFTLAFDNDKLVGTAGVEAFGPTGLLRSVAVLPAYQYQKIGRQLIDASVEQATNRGVETLYLITTTADGYFDRLGYSRVDRTNVPEPIAQTRQFSDLCPASSVVMKKDVAPEHQLR
ncbi:arsenic resistance N-acetyltransferase ArsN2 [uncultured Fibrella sp.]|uniref:arsenic resistance N-acetyltransferase ArsN2 n=1 Tax=uncultured Fibrella sp. TaxID=1284596 RepID=UPI0035C9C7D1